MLTNFLIKKGFQVYGTSRDSLTANKTNLERLGIKEKINFLTNTFLSFCNYIYVRNRN